MAKLSIHHHERVEAHPHRWHVFLHGRSDPVCVELPREERARLDMSDDEIHAMLPTALERHHTTENREDVPPGEEYQEATTWDSPVRVMQTHFMG